MIKKPSETLKMGVFIFGSAFFFLLFYGGLATVLIFFFQPSTIEAGELVEWGVEQNMNLGVLVGLFSVGILQIYTLLLVLAWKFTKSAFIDCDFWEQQRTEIKALLKTKPRTTEK